jgi:hypothetical protein
MDMTMTTPETMTGKINPQELTEMDSINRPLGAMEKIFLLLDQISQVHFVIAAEIIGTKTISEWREALNALQLHNQH